MTSFCPNEVVTKVTRLLRICAAKSILTIFHSPVVRVAGPVTGVNPSDLGRPQWGNAAEGRSEARPWLAAFGVASGAPLGVAQIAVNSANRGEGEPADEAFARLRKKHRIPAE